MKEITTKMREDRVRRLLTKQGFKLMKTRKHNRPYECLDNAYMIVNASTNWLEAGGGWDGFNMSLDEVEKFANE